MDESTQAQMIQRIEEQETELKVTKYLIDKAGAFFPKDYDPFYEILDQEYYGDGACETVEYLLQKGCAFSSTNFYQALGIGTEVAKLFINAGADPNSIRNKCLNGPITPLMEASSDPILVKLLIQKGANVNLVDGLGNTALLHACGDWMNEKDQLQVVKLLVEAGADVNVSNADVNVPNSSGETAIERARNAKNGFIGNNYIETNFKSGY